MTADLTIDERPDGWWVTGFPGGTKNDAGPYASRHKAERAREILRPAFLAMAAAAAKRDASTAAAGDGNGGGRSTDCVGQGLLF